MKLNTPKSFSTNLYICVLSIKYGITYTLAPSLSLENDEDAYFIDIKHGYYNEAILSFSYDGIESLLAFLSGFGSWEIKFSETALTSLA